MNFNSMAFLIYLPLVVTVYWLIPHRARKYWLLAASYFFYGYWNPVFLLLLLFSTAVDYFCGLGMERYRENSRVRKLLMLTSVLMNLGLLFSFKYLDFFTQNINSFCAGLGISYRIPALNLILPVGISFYTFQTMSYTIDVYRGDYPAEKDPIAFALYVTYFPQLVAGPIESASNLLPQLKKEQHLNWEDVSAGIRLLLCGFFRKCVVADFCGIFVNQVFSGLETANSLAIFFGGALFCIQMYCDFAGYSEIAAGSARLMGVRLMRNFDRPYLSMSYTEFFRRWHISLNRWFTSYVYIPLGGSRKGTFSKMRNTVIVFALCGLWHGARWTYVLWGLYAAFWLCLESVLDIRHRFGPRWDNPLGRLTRRSVTFLIFVPAALLFRADSLEQLLVIFPRLFTQLGFGGDYFRAAFASLGLHAGNLAQLVLCIVAMARIYDWGVYDLPGAKTAHGSNTRLVSAVYMVLIIALCWLALLETQDTAGFAYFQF
ncbi:MAG: MBOAT family protein [Oscillospiraceae bacterium]|nr:MBOAT family protein [Oscillospiraceae bacterium]